jgi:hypothetical protein
MTDLERIKSLLQGSPLVDRQAAAERAKAVYQEKQFTDLLLRVRPSQWEALRRVNSAATADELRAAVWDFFGKEPADLKKNKPAKPPSRKRWGEEHFMEGLIGEAEKACTLNDSDAIKALREVTKMLPQEDQKPILERARVWQGRQFLHLLAMRVRASQEYKENKDVVL